MRVLHLIDTRKVAGTEHHIADLVEFLRKRGVEATVACRRGAVEALMERRGVPIVGLAAALGTKSGYDLLHAHNGRTTALAVLGKRLARCRRVVATMHFVRPARLSRRGALRDSSVVMHRVLNTQVDALIAVSGRVADAVLERQEIAEAKVNVVLNGVSDPAAAHRQEEPFEFRGWRNVLCAARLSREKGLDHLIEAIALLRSRYPLVRLWVAGEGELLGELEARGVALGVAEGVTFLGRRDDVPSLMAAAEVVVLPAPEEPFGLVLVEAMAMGRPVVACDGGGPREIVLDGVTGLLVGPGDSQAMADAIARLLEHPEQARALGAAGRARYLEQFTAASMAERTLRVYERVLGLSQAFGGDDMDVSLDSKERSRPCGYS